MSTETSEAPFDPQAFLQDLQQTLTDWQTRQFEGKTPAFLTHDQLAEIKSRLIVALMKMGTDLNGKEKLLLGVVTLLYRHAAPSNVLMRFLTGFIVELHADNAILMGYIESQEAASARNPNQSMVSALTDGLRADMAAVLAAARVRVEKGVIEAAFGQFRHKFINFLKEMLGVEDN